MSECENDNSFGLSFATESRKDSELTVGVSVSFRFTKKWGKTIGESSLVITIAAMTMTMTTVTIKHSC